jgi:hypothetical protein
MQTCQLTRLGHGRNPIIDITHTCSRTMVLRCLIQCGQDQLRRLQTRLPGNYPIRTLAEGILGSYSATAHRATVRVVTSVRL